jgi:vacuolar-type H+-ATPase subunit E/Vma4
VKAKKDVLKTSGENAREICSMIMEESSEEARLILSKAEKEKNRVLSEASRKAEDSSKVILSDAEKEIERNRERIFSTVNMEKRKVRLETKSLFADDVIAAVKREAENFRSSGDYVKFLREAVLEGLKVIGSKRAQVFYSRLDEEAIAQISDLSVEFKKSDFVDIGVMVQSEDNRLLFDNTFSAKLRRVHDEIYSKLLKEAF